MCNAIERLCMRLISRRVRILGVVLALAITGSPLVVGAQQRPPSPPVYVPAPELPNITAPSCVADPQEGICLLRTIFREQQEETEMLKEIQGMQRGRLVVEMPSLVGLTCVSGP